ncbi:MAG TPA: glycosyltransferase family 4 protein [Gemmatimonadaceae bacterium]
MKVAIVTPGGVDESGTERVIPAFLWLIERLARRHDVHVFALAQEPRPRDWTLLGATVHNVGTVGARRLRFHRMFAREHRVAPFDVVHALFGGAALHALSAAAWFRLPLLTHLTGGELVSLPEIGYGARLSRRGRIATRLVVSGSTRITVGTPHMRRLAESLDIDAGLVPLGVALDRWPPCAPRVRNATRPARLLHVADLRPVKDQPMLLTAAALLRARGLQFELHIAGFDTTDGATRRSAAAYAVEDVVHWHGLLGRAPLRQLMQESDLLVHTSRHEAGPMAVLEAALAGVPTVGTDVGHVNEWAPDAAVAVPVGDARALADAVALLLTDEPRRIAIAREAQRRAIAIDADHTATSFERLYEEMLAERGR